jgi:hypothetical protein
MITAPRHEVSSRGFGVSSVIGDFLVIAMGLTSSFVIHLVGDLPISEVILLAVLPLLFIARGNRVLRRDFLPTFLLIGLWLMGQILTDVYRQTATSDWMRGDANILFLSIDLAGFIILLGGNDRRKVLYLAAAPMSSLLMTTFHPNAYAAGAPWKFGYASATITLVVLVSCVFYQKRKFGLVILLIAAIAAVNLLLNFRSPVLELLVTVALVVPVIPERLGSLRLLPRRGSGMRLAVLAGMALAASLAAVGLVDIVTESGLLGQEAQQKNQEQSRASGGLLFGGRPEVIIGARAVLDSPIIGHGSWATDDRYVEMYEDLEAQNGVAQSLEYLEETAGGLIPSHSHLMGAWVWAGILGAPIWVYILWMIILSIIRLSNQEIALAPIYAYTLIGFLWSILFSPLGSTQRMPDAFAIVLVFDLVAAPLSDSRSTSIGWRFAGGRSVGRLEVQAPARAGMRNISVDRARFIRPPRR